MVIVWDGSRRRMGIWISAHFIISCVILLPLFFPGKIFGKLRHPSVSFFVWTVAWDRVLTGDNLWGRGFYFVDWCVMCRCCGKIVDHLLLHCGKAHRLWSFVFNTFGVSWVLSRSVTDFLFGWWNWLEKHSSNIWNLAPWCLMWCIWRECNRQTFEDLDRSDDQLLAFFSSSLFDWSRVWGLTSSESLPLFLSSLFLCI